MLAVLFALLSIFARECHSSDLSSCDEEETFCPKVGLCVNVTVPCGRECLSTTYPKLWEEENECVEALNCDYDEWQCGREERISPVEEIGRVQ